MIFKDSVSQTLFQRLLFTDFFSKTFNQKTSMNHITRKLNGFLPAALFSLLIWIMASVPNSELGRIYGYIKIPWRKFFLSDAFVHFLGFGLLTLLICRGYHWGSKRSIPVVMVVLLASGYGLFIEVFQAILPWRTFGLDDLAWDTAGVLCFACAAKWTEKISH
jgi:glycopeptide antibiotics resistance protein